MTPASSSTRESGVRARETASRISLPIDEPPPAVAVDVCRGRRRRVSRRAAVAADVRLLGVVVEALPRGPGGPAHQPRIKEHLVAVCLVLRVAILRGPLGSHGKVT